MYPVYKNDFGREILMGNDMGDLYDGLPDSTINLTNLTIATYLAVLIDISSCNWFQNIPK